MDFIVDKVNLHEVKNEKVKFFFLRIRKGIFFIEIEFLYILLYMYNSCVPNELIVVDVGTWVLVLLLNLKLYELAQAISTKKIKIIMTLAKYLIVVPLNCLQ